jgi:HEAT repeat protein
MQESPFFSTLNGMNPDIQQLIDQLDENEPAARVAACNALGQFGATNADTRGLLEHGIPAIERILRDDPIREVRWAAAYALGALGDAEAIPALEAAYQQAADDTGLRLVIVKALGKTGHSDAVVGLRDKMREGESRCIRAAAAKALERIAAYEAQRP